MYFKIMHSYKMAVIQNRVMGMGIPFMVHGILVIEIGKLAKDRHMFRHAKQELFVEASCNYL